MLLKGSCKLIGAGGGLKSALDAFEAAYNLIHRHSCDQSGYALGVSGATAVIFYA